MFVLKKDELFLYLLFQHEIQRLEDPGPEFRICFFCRHVGAAIYLQLFLNIDYGVFCMVFITFDLISLVPYVPHATLR